MAPKGPLGGPRPFANDDKKVLVLAGIDGEEPPRDLLIDIEAAMQGRMNKAYGLNPGITTVNLTTNPHPSKEQKEVLGQRTQHVQQYEVQTPWEEITQEQINTVHHEVTDKLNDLGFNVTGTETTVI